MNIELTLLIIACVLAIAYIQIKELKIQLKVSKNNLELAEYRCRNLTTDLLFKNIGSEEHKKLHQIKIQELHYNDKVKVIDGFYKGQEGIVTDEILERYTINEHERNYAITLMDGKITVESIDNLKLIK